MLKRHTEQDVITIERSEPFSPSTFEGRDLSIGEQDERSLVLSEVDRRMIFPLGIVSLAERSARGEDVLKRLKSKKHIRLDAKIGEVLWKDYALNKENSILEWLRLKKLIRFLPFMGTVLEDLNGRRLVFCLFWWEAEWSSSFRFLEDQWSTLQPPVCLFVSKS